MISWAGDRLPPRLTFAQNEIEKAGLDRTERLNSYSLPPAFPLSVLFAVTLAFALGLVGAVLS